MPELNVWGVDVGIKHIACVGLVKGAAPVAWQIDFRYHSSMRLPDKLATMDVLLQPWWRENWQVFAPGQVWVEQPAGKFVNVSLYCAYGIVLSSLRQALAELTPYPVPILPIVPGEWKKSAIGKGDASKETIMAWAREEGFTHESGDVLDAFGVATAALVQNG